MPLAGKQHTFVGRTVQGKQIFGSIVTDGLLLYLDANNNLSYNGSGSTWYNLASSSSNINLQGSPTFNLSSPKNLSFNGSNQYGTGGGITVPQATYTKCVWFKLSSYSTNNNLVSSQAGGHFMFFGATNKLHCGHTNWINYGLTFLSYPSATTFNLDTWYFAVLTFDTLNGMKLYINDNLDSTYTQKTIHSGDESTDIASFGGDNLLNGAISMVMTYNRAISASEVSRNYQITKSLFGY